MADEAVKTAVLKRLRQLHDERMKDPDVEPTKPLVEAATIRGVRAGLGFKPEEVSCTKLGDALRSLHNGERIRCARPREGIGEPRPYHLFLLDPVGAER